MVEFRKRKGGAKVGEITVDMVSVFVLVFISIELYREYITKVQVCRGFKTSFSSLSCNLYTYFLYLYIL